MVKKIWEYNYNWFNKQSRDVFKLINEMIKYTDKNNKKPFTTTADDIINKFI